MLNYWRLTERQWLLMTLAAKDTVTTLNILYSLLGDFGIKITPIIAPGMELNDLTRSINLALNL